MNRRESLRTLLVASGGLVALPSWATEWQKTDLVRHFSTYTIAEQEILASVVDTIIPAGNSIGALSVGVDKFLQKLFDDCYEPEVQNNIKTQLDHLERSSQQEHGKSFSACDQSQRAALLLKLDSSSDQEEKDFFRLVKSETIRGFNTSRDVMVTYLKYKPAPGHYYGCVDAKA